MGSEGFSPDTIDALLRVIKNEAAESASSDDERIQAITQVGNFLTENQNTLASPRAMICLTDVIREDVRPRVVTHAISVLARVKAVSAVMLIVDVALGSNTELFDNADADRFRESDDCLRLRCAAVQALGQFQDQRIVIPLMSILNDQTVNYRLRMKAAESLGKAGDPHALTSLMRILEDEREKSVYLKESSAKALGMLGDIRAMDSLLNILESKKGIRDKFDFLKERAIESIKRLMDGDEPGESNRVFESLINALQDEAPSIRLAAVEALAESGERRFIHDLRDVIFDSADDVAIAAIYAIFRLGGEDAIRDLRGLENVPQFLRDEIESFIP